MLDFLSVTIDDKIDVTILVGSAQGAPLSLQIMAINWSSIDKIDACNDDLIVTITEVLTGNKIPTRNRLISPIDLFGLYPKQIGCKNYEKEICVPSPSYLPTNVPKRKKERGSRQRHSDSEENKGGGGVSWP